MLFRTALGLLLASALTLAAQQPPAAPPADQSQTARFGAAASGVVVDVVVRDKRGQPVSNLTATDFAILEDGVRQKIVAFEPYTPADVPRPCRRCGTRGGIDGDRRPDAQRRLAEAHRSSRWRGTDWSRKGGPSRTRPRDGSIQTKAPGELVGVFLTDMTLRTIQPYTTDGRLLGEAVETLARRRPRR